MWGKGKKPTSFLSEMKWGLRDPKSHKATWHVMMLKTWLYGRKTGPDPLVLNIWEASLNFLLYVLVVWFCQTLSIRLFQVPQWKGRISIPLCFFFSNGLQVFLCATIGTCKTNRERDTHSIIWCILYKKFSVSRSSMNKKRSLKATKAQ